MINITNKHITQSALYAVVSSALVVLLLFATFFIAEPTISYGQADTADFYVRQNITDETSFLVNPSSLNTSGDINGVTGGNATGTSSFVVKSNNSAGYYVEIDFFDNGTNPYVAMLGDEDDSEALRNYSAATSTPTFAFTASTAAQFAYTITSSTSADTGDLFLHNGGTYCGTGSTQTAEACWMTPSTTAVRIVDTTGPANTGASSTLTFKINVPSGAVPVPTAQTYTATATLSLFVK